MKPFTAIVSVLLACTIASSHAASLHRVRRQVVPREFANINIENYLKNDRAVAFQLKCIVYDGPCDRIGKYLKVTIPELLTNQCQNCDPAQRQRAGRLVQHIQQKYPKEWSDAVQKFQGGQVKKEDADKLEALLGVKLDSKLVAEAPAPVSTEAPSTTAASTAAPTAAASSTAAVPAAVVSSTAAPVPVVPAAEVSSTSAPAPAASSTEAAVSTAAPAVSSSESPAVPTSAVPLASSSAAPVAVSSEAPVSSSAAPEVTSSTVAALTASSSETPAAPVSSAAPAVTSSSPSSNDASSSAAPVAA